MGRIDPSGKGVVNQKRKAPGNPNKGILGNSSENKQKERVNRLGNQKRKLNKGRDQTPKPAFYLRKRKNYIMLTNILFNFLLYCGHAE